MSAHTPRASSGWLRQEYLAVFAAVIVALIGIVLWIIFSRSAQRVERANIGLLEAARSGDLAAIKSCFREGADANHYPKQTPLAASLRGGYLECAEYLLSQGARTDFDGPDRLLENLVIGLAYGHPLQSGDDVRCVRLVKLLVSKGANPKRKGEHGCTPLHWASAAGANLLVLDLLDRGVDINARADTGSTPLFLAAVFGREETVKLLLNHGGNSRLTGVRGHTPLQAAEFHKKDAVVRLLKKYEQARKMGAGPSGSG